MSKIELNQISEEILSKEIKKGLLKLRISNVTEAYFYIKSNMRGFQLHLGISAESVERILAELKSILIKEYGENYIEDISAKWQNINPSDYGMGLTVNKKHDDRIEKLKDDNKETTDKNKQQNISSNNSKFMQGE